MNTSKLSADAKLVLHAIVSLGGNTAIIAILPTLLPTWAVAIVFLVFNLAQVVTAFIDPTFAIHLIQTGQMAAPTKDQ
jgi:energy-converting hydrogenase Eha subunit E